ncbi:hypothetical protein B0J18DRAFT_144112 [Chaetomium sp. MPI-SDFR-AT-0129]|nr:hypothetical protein B0J18DRAFT_144112 [Chaetomium sp. MPI-SDFR-AT-0129]
MAETAAIPIVHGNDGAKFNGPDVSSGTISAKQPGPRPPRQNLNQIYTLPAPIRTFPLPTFYPNNPVSLLYLAYAWLSQVLQPPPNEPSVVHTGYWDPETRSVHIRDEPSIRALWEQGFYGKGSLSRSEPNWLKRELARRGSPEGKTVSEARTELRREERRLAKWERAKAELEAIEKQRFAEAAAHVAAGAKKLDDLEDSVEVTKSVVVEVAEPAVAEAEALPTEPSTETVPELVAESPEVLPADSPSEPKSPVGPAELLALPNSLTSLHGVASQPLVLPEKEPTVLFRAPVGPAELLALPNSVEESFSRLDDARKVPEEHAPVYSAPVGPLELLLLPNSHMDLPTRPSGLGIFEVSAAPIQPTVQEVHLVDALSETLPRIDGPENEPTENSLGAPAEQILDKSSVVNGDEPASVTLIAPVSEVPTVGTSTPDSDSAVPQSKRRKSVRFSPTVESATFLHYESPISSGPNADVPKANGDVPTPETAPATGLLTTGSSSTEIENKEHFQLSPEEAFFLTFSLGALRVVDPITDTPIPTEHLLSLFRAHSYFPPQPLASAHLRPDDPFLVHYAVYHHFRSLGWVPRHGIKFGVDWIIYARGPVFDHSEFGIVVMPSYGDKEWAGQHKREDRERSWSWLMGVNRVLSHVLKSLVLVYVDIPPPGVFDEAMRAGGIAAALKKYGIREVMVRRFSANRNR